MKKLALLLAIAVAFTACQKSISGREATESANRRGADDVTVPPPANLPSAVLNAFTAKYPTATRMEWEPEDGNTWKVKFFLGNVRWIAVFKADGTLISARIKN